MSISIGLILDGLVALLLIVTLFYCFVLNRRLGDLRSGQDGMRDLIKALNEATDRAQASITQLKGAGESVAAHLQGDVAKARSLADELSLMVETGNNIADRLSGTASKATTAGEAQLKELSAAVGQTSSRSDDDDDVSAEQSMMKALRHAR